MSNVSLKEHNRTKLLRIFGVLYYTGIRVNEISAITIGKLKEIIQDHDGVIYTSKKNKERKLYLSDEACKKLKQLIKGETNDEAYLVRSWNKETTPMHPISLINAVNSYMRDVLGAGYTSHSFRQGLISQMLEAQISTPAVRDFIGHADAATTLKYAKATDSYIHNSLVR